MKIHPLFLFIILLTVLIVIVLFSKMAAKKEGFIGFNNNEVVGENYKVAVPKDNGNPTKVPLYNASKPIYYVYDHVYFDPTNGNLIDLSGDQYTPQTNGGTTPTYKINELKIIDRTGTQVAKVVSPTTGNITDAEKSKNSTVISKEIPFVYRTLSTGTTNSYDIVYIPLGIYTMIFAFDLTVGIVPYILIYPNGINQLVYGNNAILDPDDNLKSISTSDSNANNGQLIILTEYSLTRKVKQLSPTCWIDPSNGYYIIKGKNNAIKRYDGKQEASGDIRLDFSKENDTYYIIFIDANNNIIIYCNFNNYIGLYTFSKIMDNNSLKLVLGNYAVIDKNKSVAAPATTATATTPATTTPPATAPATTTPPASGTDSTPESPFGPYTDYYKWLAYWNKNGKTGIFSEDYIEKTQVIPPVCPACPACPSVQGVCNNCGGQGGSGTQQTQTSQKSNGGIVPTTGRTIDNTVNKSADLLKSTGSGTADLLRDTGSGTADLLRDTASGTTGLLRDTASGTAGLLREAGQGTYDFLTGKWLSDGESSSERSQNNQNSGSSSSNGQRGTYQYRDAAGQGAGRRGNPDNYNYNGALTSKGGNFIPVTADFSAFGR